MEPIDWNALQTVFPLVQTILAGAAVLTVAPVVRTATEWVKVRLKKRFEGLNNLYIHGINGAFSAAAAIIMARAGRLVDEPAYAVVPEPWGVVVFAIAVFLHSGGFVDLERNQQVPPQSPSDPDLPKPIKR